MKRHASSASSFSALLVIGFLVVLAMGGCMTVRQEFDGRDRSQVWSAMTAVAEWPEYDDWHVLTNEVWQAPDEARLEVYREVQRSIHKPGQPHRVERREWRFRIELLDTDPPSARFISRGFAIPAHARIEGDRYFADVWRMLGGRSVPEASPDREDRSEEPARETDSDTSPPVDDEAEDAPLIDIDDVTGDG